MFMFMFMFLVMSITQVVHIMTGCYRKNSIIIDASIDADSIIGIAIGIGIEHSFVTCSCS